MTKVWSSAPPPGRPCESRPPDNSLSRRALHQLCVHEIAQRPRERAVERPARHEHQPAPGRIRIDPGLVPPYHRGPTHAEAQLPAVAARDLDLVASLHVAQEREMRIAVRRIDRRAPLAPVRRALD